VLCAGIALFQALVLITSIKETISMKKTLLSSCFLVLFMFFSCSPIFAQHRGSAKVDSFQVLANNFVNLLLKKDYTAALKKYKATVIDALPAEKLEQEWKTMLSEVGAYHGQLDMRKEKDQEYTVVFVSCNFEKTPVDVKIVFTNTKQIAGVFLIPTQSTCRIKPTSGSKSSKNN
jgi:hypothetical protein